VSVQWHHEKSIPFAVSTGNQQSSRLLSINNANGLAILPSKTTEMLRILDGTIVDVIVIDQL
jgi:hypothetical protein